MDNNPQANHQPPPPHTQRLPKGHPIFTLGRARMGIYTGIQLACFSALWMVKSNQRISIFFPSVIIFLMALRTLVLPKIFTPYELTALGDVQPQIVRKKISEKRIYNLRAKKVKKRVAEGGIGGGGGGGVGGGGGGWRRRRN